HQAAVIDSIGRYLATERFETTPEGYRRLLDWLRSHGEVLAVGIEGTGAYGAEIARFLTANEVTVVEVDRPDGFPALRLNRRRSRGGGCSARGCSIDGYGRSAGRPGH
ncbi:transposase, partial [Streptomyces sp. NPDC023998]|uniref:IS110 family transposase n=1 Tax=Streptomyces sp. NPDC023998 TaxID=3154597 RepID=UPI0033C0428B